jgi:hypothetical protein
MLPWVQAGRVAWSLPVVTRHWADPPLPAMNELQLVAAHRHDGCTCHPESEERHTLAEWDAIEARQRAFAADPAAVEAESREIERATAQAQKAGAA